MADTKSATLLRYNAKELRGHAAIINTALDKMRNDIAAKERQRDEMLARAAEYESSATALGAKS